MDDLHVAEQIRAFNRFYTEAIGSLDQKHEGLDLSLVESRILFTVEALDSGCVNDIADRLGLDLAYTSRVLGILEDAKLIRRKISTQDRRQRIVSLTRTGTQLLNEVKARSNQRVLGLISHLDPGQVHDLLNALSIVQNLIGQEESGIEDGSNPATWSKSQRRRRAE